MHISGKQTTIIGINFMLKLNLIERKKIKKGNSIKIKLEYL